MSTFSEEIRKKTDSVWTTVFEHPFVKGIGNGNLDRDKFEFYLKQDYIYLIDFSRVFSLASAKARQLSDMGYFATLLNVTLNMEMDLHRRTCADFGISAEELEKTDPAETTLSYTNFLVKTCYEETLPGILSVLLPCAAGYVEIGQKLKKEGLPDLKHYRDWIETYSSNEFIEFVVWLKNRLDQLTVSASTEDKAHWYRLYLNSSRFEYLFFDMSWNMKTWPKEIIA
jgi:thiaminase/transcriptional activator TenA